MKKSIFLVFLLALTISAAPAQAAGITSLLMQTRAMPGEEVEAIFLGSSDVSFYRAHLSCGNSVRLSDGPLACGLWQTLDVGSNRVKLVFSNTGSFSEEVELSLVAYSKSGIELDRRSARVTVEPRSMARIESFQVTRSYVDGRIDLSWRVNVPVGIKLEATCPVNATTGTILLQADGGSQKICAEETELLRTTTLSEEGVITLYPSGNTSTASAALTLHLLDAAGREIGVQETTGVRLRGGSLTQSRIPSITAFSAEQTTRGVVLNWRTSAPARASVTLGCPSRTIFLRALEQNGRYGCSDSLDFGPSRESGTATLVQESGAASLATFTLTVRTEAGIQVDSRTITAVVPIQNASALPLVGGALHIPLLLLAPDEGSVFVADAPLLISWDGGSDARLNLYLVDQNDNIVGTVARNVSGAEGNTYWNAGAIMEGALPNVAPYKIVSPGRYYILARAEGGIRYEESRSGSFSINPSPLARTAPSSAAPSVTVNNPVAGETWKTGGGTSVKWEATGLGVTAPTTIEMVERGGLRYRIAENIFNTGEYLWSNGNTVQGVSVPAGVYELSVCVNTYCDYATRITVVSKVAVDGPTNFTALREQIRALLEQVLRLQNNLNDMENAAALGAPSSGSTESRSWWQIF